MPEILKENTLLLPCKDSKEGGQEVAENICIHATLITDDLTTGDKMNLTVRLGKQYLRVLLACLGSSHLSGSGRRFDLSY